MRFVPREKGEKTVSDYKETAVFNVPKEHSDYLREDSGFVEHIVKHISSQLAERIMRILEQEEEIIVRQSDLCVSEFMPTNSVEYRRQINWSPLVRCKDCKYFDLWGPKGKEKFDCDRFIDSPPITPEWYCAWGERREDVSIS